MSTQIVHIVVCTCTTHIIVNIGGLVIIWASHKTHVKLNIKKGKPVHFPNCIYDPKLYFI